MTQGAAQSPIVDERSFQARIRVAGTGIHRRRRGIQRKQCPGPDALATAKLRE
jgi:hypothetical protein